MKIAAFVLGLMALASPVMASDITRIQLDSANVPEIGLAQGSGVNITLFPQGELSRTDGWMTPLGLWFDC
jgi:hypothetical protein